jgi:hypothetical protein
VRVERSIGRSFVGGERYGTNINSMCNFNAMTLDLHNFKWRVRVLSLAQC